MITITICGPQGSGKTKLLPIVARAIEKSGLNVKAYDAGELTFTGKRRPYKATVRVETEQT